MAYWEVHHLLASGEHFGGKIHSVMQYYEKARVSSGASMHSNYRRQKEGSALSLQKLGAYIGNYDMTSVYR